MDSQLWARLLVSVELGLGLRNIQALNGLPFLNFQLSNFQINIKIALSLISPNFICPTKTKNFGFTRFVVLRIDS